MTKKFKNTIRPAFLWNFTTKVKTRYILINRNELPIKNLNSRIKSITESANLSIQKLNVLIHKRQIPYISLELHSKKFFSRRTRAFIHNEQTTAAYVHDLKDKISQEDELTHILEILVANGFKKITISQLDCDAEIILDGHLLDCAIIDIVLDIVMFNSYSFLKTMSTTEKKNFSKQKFEFFKSQNLSCFYDCKGNDPIYYSLAFSARKGISDFNLSYYIELWDKFIAKYYGDKTHVEKSVTEQLKQHMDIGELPKNTHRRFANLSSGAYLLLRTNTKRTEKIQPQLCTLFGIKTFRKGKLKVVPLNEFDTHKPLLVNLDVSAFKIIVP